MTPQEENSEPLGYLPIYALPYWDEIGSFVRAAVHDAATDTRSTNEIGRGAGRSSREFADAATPFVFWCWQARAMPLERRRIFRRDVIDQFAHLALPHLARGSMATHRSALHRMADLLNPDGPPHTQHPIGRSDPLRPYTPPEVSALHSWASSQNTLRRRHDALTLLILGLGAGLATRELLDVRPLDIRLRGQALVITVTGSRPREVPVLSEWRPSLERIIDAVDPTQWLFRPGRLSSEPGKVTDFLTRARTTLDVKPNRMRTTWVVRHLNDGTPASDLLRIAGLSTFAALDKLSRFRG